MSDVGQRCRLLVSWVILVGLVMAGGIVPARGATEVPVGMWPLTPEPRVVRAFDPPSAPWASGHRGVDLAARAGQPVLAPFPGVVSFAGPLAGKPVVVVTHGTTRTTYEPVVPSVSIGDQVAPGSVLGVLAAGPSHCAPAACLHWGWKRGEEYLDPLLLVGAAPIRLLPLDGSTPVSGGIDLGPGVGLTVGGAQPFAADMGVELGGG